MKQSKLHFPWISLLLAAFLVFTAYPAFHGLVSRLLQQAGIAELPPLPVLLVAWGFITLLELLVFYRRKFRVDRYLASTRGQLDELLDSRRQLRSQVRTQTDHADHLKRFVSERLLDYIEYDEKFLHFKHIAAEIRHNGAISFDRVQSALQQAMLDSEVSGSEQYQQAADSLRYLWDLIDLATTDNLALYISNRVYDCEEVYFQAQLEMNSSGGQFPLDAVFSVSEVIRRTLSPLVDDPAAMIAALQPTNHSVYYEDQRFRVEIRRDSELLGNPNHLVLMLENLIANALYFNEKPGFRSASNRVVVRLARQAGQAEISVFNHGPPIREQHAQELYKLGHSTRRERGHHGKGLGLYFVDQIVRGFEGVVDYRNLENNEFDLQLVFDRGTDNEENHELSVSEVDGRLHCFTPSGQDEKNRCEISRSKPLQAIEVISGRNTVAVEPEQRSESSLFDDVDPLLPRWRIDIKNQPRSARVTFTPLDQRGVRFLVLLPTAQSRLEQAEAEDY